MGNETSSRDCNNDCYAGHGGAVCSVSDVLRATGVSNALSDDTGIGNQVYAAAFGKYYYLKN